MKKSESSLAGAFPKGKPGRPKGSTSKGNSVGVMRAREWATLHYDNQIPSTLAAQQTADKWAVQAADVFRDFRRHEHRLVDEINRETEEIKRELERMKSSNSDSDRRKAGLSYCLDVFLSSIGKDVRSKE